jgi:periplasmic protein CpxP/Spy
MGYGKMGKMLAAAVLAVGVAVGAQGGAQAVAQDGPGMGQGPGRGAGPFFRQQFGSRRPPMERAFGAMGVARFWHDPAVVNQLKITDEQQKSMDEILQEHRESLIDLDAGLQKAELKLGPMLKADQPNESEIEGQIDSIAQARANLEKANARFLLAIRAKLTPEQWKGLQQLREQRMDRFRDGGRRRMMTRRQGPGPQGAAPQGAPADGGPDGGPGGAAPGSAPGNGPGDM